MSQKSHNSYSADTDESLGDSICVINDHKSGDHVNTLNDRSLAQTISVVSNAGQSMASSSSAQFHEEGSLLIHRHNPLSMSLFGPNNSLVGWDKCSLMLKFQSDKVKMYRLQVNNILNEFDMNPDTFELTLDEKMLLEDVSTRIMNLANEIASCARCSDESAERVKIQILSAMRQLDEQMQSLYARFMLPKQVSAMSNSNSATNGDDSSVYDIISMSNDLNASLSKKKDKIAEQNRLIRGLIQMMCSDYHQSDERA